MVAIVAMKADEIPGRLADACPAVKLAGPQDAVAGVVPTWLAFPATVDEAAGVLRAAAAAGLAVVPRGAGSTLAGGPPPRRCDLVVDTSRMDRVLEHAAGDLVVRAEAGTTMGALARVLATAGQRISLDADPASTVGGVVAAGTAGPLRLRYGTPRDLLIGMTVVRADGTVARSGGKVVKNVAGYDVGKLFAGSHGTLGLVADVTFRLHPVPPARAFVTCVCGDPRGVADPGALAFATRQDTKATSAADATARAVLRAAASPLVPSAVEIDKPLPGGPVRVAVLLEGSGDGVTGRAARMADQLALWGEVRTEPDPPPWWSRQEGTAAAGATVVRVAFWAAALRRVLDALDAAAARAGVKPAVGGSAGAGVVQARLEPGTEPGSVAAFVATLREVVSPSGRTPGSGGSGDRDGGASVRGSVVVTAAPPEVRRHLDPWGPVPAIALMRAVKDQFDPEHRMAPGRFPEGI